MNEHRLYHHLVPIDNLNPSQALTVIRDLLHIRGIPKHIVTLNIAMYCEARSDPRFRDLLTQALVLPESTGLSLYSKINPPKLVRTNGLMLADELVRYCADQGEKIVLFGSSQANRSLAELHLLNTVPAINVTSIDGDYNFADESDSEIVAGAIDRSAASLAIMAGTEVEAEKWINLWLIQHKAKVKLVGNFGQTIDYWAGRRPYVPPLARKSGFEWIFRLTRESPERRQRYKKVLLMFGKLVLLDTLNMLMNKNNS